MKQVLYIITIVFLASCTSNTIYKKPKNLIPKDSMKMLLKDMYIATSAKYTKNKFLQKDINYMALVYEKYKIDSVRFEESNFYYNTKIEIYNEILKDVKKELENQRDTFDVELKRQDSIELLKVRDKDLKTDSLQKKTHKKLDTLIKRLDMRQE